MTRILALALLAATAAPAVAWYEIPPPPITFESGNTPCNSYYDTVAYVRNVGSVCMYNAPNDLS
jgi:hypothetical protein